MAGSLQNFVYTTDFNNAGIGFDKALRLDESNLRAIGYTPSIVYTNQPVPPQVLRLVPRYILVKGRTTGGKEVSRKIVVLDSGNLQFQTGGQVTLPVLVGDVSEAVVFDITGSVGEKKTFAASDPATDTGQDDGTQP